VNGIKYAVTGVVTIAVSILFSVVAAVATPFVLIFGKEG